jgi:hypothetical protein
MADEAIYTEPSIDRTMEEDLERFEAAAELQMYKEYRDVLPMFRYVVETERRFYLANRVDVERRSSGGTVYFEVTLEDAWVWDMFRPARFLQRVTVLSFRDVNIEEIERGVTL